MQVTSRARLQLLLVIALPDQLGLRLEKYTFIIKYTNPTEEHNSEQVNEQI